MNPTLPVSASHASVQTLNSSASSNRTRPPRCRGDHQSPLRVSQSERKRVVSNELLAIAPLYVQQLLIHAIYLYTRRGIASFPPFLTWHSRSPSSSSSSSRSLLLSFQQHKEVLYTKSQVHRNTRARFYDTLSSRTRSKSLERTRCPVFLSATSNASQHSFDPP